MIQVTPIPAFNDNYLWLLEGNGETWVVDPGDGQAVANVLEEKSAQLTGILVTHHHADHVGGIDHLREENTVIAGPKRSQFRLVNLGLEDGDTVEVCGVRFNVLEVPGHTLNHLAYFADVTGQSPLLFCGDTLFTGGCGRLFEGTPTQMFQSLRRLSDLPRDTLVYCAHEYTVANLSFAASLEPDNPKLEERILQTQRLREKNIPSVPSTIGLELETNPFLRADIPAIVAAARKNNAEIHESPESVFAEIRRMKDVF